MKNFLFIALFFFAHLISFSQSFNVAEHNGSTRTFNMVGINNKSYYLQVNTPMQYCCYDEVRLIGRDNNGNVIMNSIVATGPWMNYARVSVTEKQTLLVYAGTEWGDCDIAAKKFYVSERDTSGNILWSVPIVSNTKIDALFALPSGNRIMLAENALIRLGAGGQILSPPPYTVVNYGNLNSVCVLNNGNILLSGNSTLMEIDTLGNTINTTSINPFTELSQVPTGEIFGISSGNLVKLSPTYSVLATSSFSNFSAKAYCYKNDSIFVCGNGANLIPKYILSDTMFNVLHQSSSNLEQIQCTGITVDNSKTVKILSYGSSIVADMNNPTASHFFSSYFHTNVSGNLNGKQDIGLIDVKINSAYRVWNSYSPNYIILKGTATVKNFGTETIKGFKLNFYALVSGASYCIVGLNKYYGITLHPGDTVSIATGSFDSFSYPNICMFTSVPDSLNDYEISNNQVCITATTVVTGIKEYSHETELNIFPNPSGGVVNINASEAITKLEIFDYSGKQVGLYFPNNQNFELKENTLAAGLYVFKITTANSTVVRKVVIE